MPTVFLLQQLAEILKKVGIMESFTLQTVKEPVDTSHKKLANSLCSPDNQVFQTMLKHFIKTLERNWARLI